MDSKSVNPENTWYFIYGSNLNRERLEGRLSELQASYRGKVNCVLEDFAFAYNKLSVDKSSKGNIYPEKRSRVFGIAILLPRNILDSFIANFEKGYQQLEVTVLTLNAGTPDQLRAVTCISDVLTDAQPSDEYVAAVVDGARQNKLPVTYIETELRCFRKTD